jgi:hypothetical protein
MAPLVLVAHMGVNSSRRGKQVKKDLLKIEGT